MGSCISKCIPQKSSHDQEEEYDQFNHVVQDKLVIISKPPPPPPTIQIPLTNPNKISPSPRSPSTNSTSSASSFTSSSTNTATSSLSSFASSRASSAALISTSSKECCRSPSFSNEFLWSCYKENPHIVRISSIKENSSNHNIKPVVSTPKQVSSSELLSSFQQKKRVRSSSPSNTTLTRQKSFRRDQPQYQKPLRDNYCRTLTRSSSPSPSRRFVHGDLVNARKLESLRHSERMVTNSTSFSRKENINDNINFTTTTSARLIRPCLRSSSSAREQKYCNKIHRIGSKIDEIAAAEAVVDQHEIDSVLMEDIDNPLISLDCFIFL